MCAPTSEPFSRTQTVISCFAACAFWSKRQAVAKPAGPAPTIATSIAMDSRCILFLWKECRDYVEVTVISIHREKSVFILGPIILNLKRQRKISYCNPLQKITIR